MNAQELDSYLNGFGKSHSELVTEGLLPSGDLIEIYDGSLAVFREICPGMYFNFWAEDQRFESLTFSLAETATSKDIYQENLPEPYSGCTTREATINLLGEPIQSKGPHKMPSPLGDSGGWDRFELAGHEELDVLFRYDIALNVVILAFGLKVSGYDRLDDEAQQQTEN
ncbi:hypothetical protein IAE39_000745 [Pseudomonas sp. S37]|uniref:DUF6392 family protein n=1 Tax=Pseudomonas sp. S37 TaxID=2767449 RepID=UPI001913BFF4|nr:DUF6392 family protein [Pseudomonas sp. S37]MBK4992571.1 hypothetical protein [Pseudomonas sp. S37]